MADRYDFKIMPTGGDAEVDPYKYYNKNLMPTGGDPEIDPSNLYNMQLQQDETKYDWPGAGDPCVSQPCYTDERIWYRTDPDVDDNWTEHSGDVFTVGPSGDCAPYDYADLNTAIAAASAAPAVTVILLYPGSYNLKDAINIGSKNVIIRGMGCTIGACLHQSTNTANYGFLISGSGQLCIFEWFETNSRENWRASIALGQCSSGTDVYINKMFLNQDINPELYGVHFNYTGTPYEGNAYLTYSRIDRGYGQYIDLGDAGVDRGIVSAKKMYYPNTGYGTYRCWSCSYQPNPHDYVSVATENYGHGYGEFLVKFGS